MFFRTTGFMTVLTVLGLAACPAAATTSSSYEKTALSGQEIYVFKGANLNADCSSMGKDDVRAIAGPSHGKIRLVYEKVYPSYSKGNDRYKCNSRKVDGVRGLYRSKPGFKGTDQVTLSVHSVSGNSYKFFISIKVE